MPLFVGEFEQTIDAKHRLAIPAALREQMNVEEDGRDFVVTLGPDMHLWLYPDKTYRKLLAAMSHSLLVDRESIKSDMISAFARVVKPDKQGRIVLPEKSMQRAKIAERVTLVGRFDWIVIWPTEEWDGRVERELPEYPETFFAAADWHKRQQ